MKTKWYRFVQNNSGGKFAEPALAVWVEANDANQANIRAANLDIYFDGCDAGVDCSCCGDRWDRASEDDARADEPMEVTKEEYLFDRAWGSSRVPLAVKYPLDPDSAWIVLPVTSLVVTKSLKN